jgi:hypothetical protein
MKHFVLSLVAIAALCVPVSAQNRVKNLYASFNKLNIEQLQNTEQTVQLNRYLFAGYNTICLPMSVSAEQLQAAAKGARLERLVGMKQEGKTLNLYFMECTDEGIEAGSPYLIFAPTSQYIRLKNSDAMNIGNKLNYVSLNDDCGNKVSFGSNWESVSREGLYGIPAKQDVQILESVLVRTEADKIFLPTRCGFNWEQQSSTATDLDIRHIKVGDEMTGVSSIDNGTLTKDNAVYDLSGRKVTTAKRGIVVENGKKVLK